MLVEQSAAGDEDESQNKKYHEQACLIQQYASKMRNG